MKNLPLHLVTVVPFVAGVALFAADVWVAKPFTEWSDKDVQKIMMDSPWAKKVSVSIDMGRGPAGAPAGGGGGGGRGGRGGGGFQGGGDQADPGTDGAGGGGGGGGGGRGGRGGGGGPEIPSVGGAPETDLTIRWQSAPTILQAWVKSQFGAQAATSPDAQKMMAPQDMFYIIWIGNLPANLRPRDEDAKKALLAVTTLNVKGKDPIVAQDVQYPPPGRGNRFADAHFLFPKKTAITADDKEVEFITKFGKTAVKAKFNLKNMEINGKLAL